MSSLTGLDRIWAGGPPSPDPEITTPQLAFVHTLPKMRRRITFAQGPDSPFDQDQVQLTSDALKLRGLDAAREERVTFGFNELPSEVALYLQPNVILAQANYRIALECPEACT